MSQLQPSNFFQYIRRRFGPQTISTIRFLTRKVQSKARWQNNLHFHLHCRHNDVTPKYLQIRTKAQGRKVPEIIRRTERALISQQVHTCNEEIRNITNVITNTERHLENTLNSTTLTSIKALLEKNYTLAYNNARTTQRQKFYKLQQQRTHTPTTTTTTTTAAKILHGNNNSTSALWE